MYSQTYIRLWVLCYQWAFTYGIRMGPLVPSVCLRVGTRVHVRALSTRSTLYTLRRDGRVGVRGRSRQRETLLSLSTHTSIAGRFAVADAVVVVVRPQTWRRRVTSEYKRYNTHIPMPLTHTYRGIPIFELRALFIAAASTHSLDRPRTIHSRYQTTYSSTYTWCYRWMLSLRWINPAAHANLHRFISEVG